MAMIVAISTLSGCSLFGWGPDKPTPDKPTTPTDSVPVNPSDPTNPSNPTDPTQPADTAICTMQMVDLGLSVKWAGYNLGASKPEEPGWFFGWGEVEPHMERGYYWGTYALGSDHTVFKYGISEQTFQTHCTKPDGRTRLMPEDDAAHVIWGDNWRMPTANEKRELLMFTEQKITTYNGVPGYVFISKANGNRIFFPFTGAAIGMGVQRQEDLVGFWTSEMSKNDQGYAYLCTNIIAGDPLMEFAGFGMDATGSASFNLSASRYIGYSIRPVYGEPVAEEPYEVTVSNVSGLTASSASMTVTTNCPNPTEVGVFWGGALKEVYPQMIAGVGEAAVADASGNVTITLPAMYQGFRLRARAYAVCDSIMYYGNTVEFTVPCPMSSITLSDTELTMHVGDTHILWATAQPVTATNKSIGWLYSDRNIVDSFIAVGTVPVAGDTYTEFRALAPGTATITAVCSSDNSITATCTVTVVE